MPDIVTARGAGRLRLQGKNLAEGETIPDGTFHRTRRNTFLNRGWIRQADPDEIFDYDPSSKRIWEIEEHIEGKKREYVARVLEAERRGQNRKSLIEKLERLAGVG